MDDERRSVIGYKARATQIRAEAKSISNPETKRALLMIAENYEKLATAVSRRQKSN